MSTPNPDQVPENWGAIAADYEQSFEALSTQFAAHALELLRLSRGDRVIDVAAGTGAFSLLAARAGADVLATDFAPGMVTRLRARIAERRLSNITAEVMNGEALGVPDASFDASVSVLGLIFFPDIAKGLDELRRVLRPGGRAAVVCWSDPAKLELMTGVMRAIRTVAPGFEPPPTAPVWARLAGAPALREQMQRAGFHRVEITESTRTLRVESPETFWTNFTRSAPPLAYLFAQLGPEQTAAAGRAYLDALRAQTSDGVPAVRVEACIGIGHV
ncbi:MAG: methyltransferase domain-containing protein [Gemmatimonadaceae bacterium]|nr:methyltransferase domain-containing protein [Gemmatimonadaceae bacterium]